MVFYSRSNVKNHASRLFCKIHGSKRLFRKLKSFELQILITWIVEGSRNEVPKIEKFSVTITVLRIQRSSRSFRIYLSPHCWLLTNQLTFRKIRSSSLNKTDFGNFHDFLFQYWANRLVHSMKIGFTILRGSLKIS